MGFPPTCLENVLQGRQRVNLNMYLYCYFSCHLRCQLDAVESKYSTQKNITQRLEIQVMDLFSRLTAYEGEARVNVGQKSSRIPEKGDW